MAAPRITGITVHHGRNVHAPFPVVALAVDVSARDQARVQDVATDLQQRAGADLEAVPAVTRPPGVVVYPFVDEKVGIAAGELAVALLSAEAPAAIDEFFALAAERLPPVQQAAVIATARARGIPVFMVSKRVLQLGHGRHQRRLKGSQTSATSNIGARLAKNKQDAYRVLRRVGLPVVPQKIVPTAAAAVTASEEIGYPVVVKPTKGHLGQGASVLLTDAAQVTTAFAFAARYGSVLVQRYIPGRDHRMLVVGDELVAVARRVPAHVTGDGVHSVEELVGVANADPRRGTGHRSILSKLRLDQRAERMLTLRGYDRHTVPPEGEVVELCDIANVSAGGTAIDVTDEVHPDNRAMAIRAGRALDLDVVGVDFLTDDISRSYREVGGAICEINSNPELRMHVWPAEGTPRDAIGPVLDLVFPPGAASRIPTAVITGNRGKKATAQLLAHILGTAGHTVGVAGNDGVLLDGEVVREGPLSTPTAVRTVVLDPAADAAVVATSPGRLLARGLGLDACDVAALLDITEPADLRSAPDRDLLDAAQRLGLEAAGGLAVVDGDDPRCVQLARDAGAERLCLVASTLERPGVREHVDGRGCAVVLDDDASIALHDTGRLVARFPVPESADPRRAMFATALAHGLGLRPDRINDGLSTFTGSVRPARLLPPSPTA